MYEEELAFANEVADEAGHIGMSFFRGRFEVHEKADHSPVTEADIAIEAAVRRAVKQRFPEDAILGEEEGLKGTGSRRWIVDPIDGTKNFADGIQIWANLIALAVDGQPVVGVVNAPALGERYEAAAGGGARLNGEPIRVSRCDRVSRAFVVYSSIEDWLQGDYAGAVQELFLESRRNRGFGDWFGHMLVARGDADVMIEPELATWDWAALRIVIEEAGGRATTLRGDPLEDVCSALTTNGVLHDEILARLASSRR